MVQVALRHAEASMLQKSAGNMHHKLVDNGQKLLERRPVASTDSDLSRLVAARQAVSEESRQLVSAALDQAQSEYLQHQCTFDAHRPSSAPQPSHATIGIIISIFY